MASRRDFLKGLVTVSGLAIVPQNFKSKIFHSGLSDRINYKGFHLFWTGWKGAENTDVLVSQWCGYEKGNKRDPNQRLFYASYPGSEGPYFRGEIFDISVKEGQIAPTQRISKAELEKFSIETLQRLMRLIDENVSVA